MQLDNQYGSPSFEDIQAFHSMFMPRLAADIGQELVDQIELEVSSPVQPYPWTALKMLQSLCIFAQTCASDRQPFWLCSGEAHV